LDARVSYGYGHRDWGLTRRDGHILACARRPVRRLTKILPIRFIEQYEQNQKLAHCCRHPENHDIEAFFSCEEEAAKGIPDVYILHCTCGRRHVRLMCGGGERPWWDAR
jgi:hypothetical protein